MKQIILPLAMLSTLITANYSYARNTQNLITGSGGKIYKVEDFLPEKNKWTFSSGLSIYENKKPELKRVLFETAKGATMGGLTGLVPAFGGPMSAVAMREVIANGGL